MQTKNMKNGEICHFHLHGIKADNLHTSFDGSSIKIVFKTIKLDTLVKGYSLLSTDISYNSSANPMRVSFSDESLHQESLLHRSHRTDRSLLHLRRSHRWPRHPDHRPVLQVRRKGAHLRQRSKWVRLRCPTVLLRRPRLHEARPDVREVLLALPLSLLC